MHKFLQNLQSHKLKLTIRKWISVPIMTTTFTTNNLLPRTTKGIELGVTTITKYWLCKGTIYQNDKVWMNDCLNTVPYVILLKSSLLFITNEWLFCTYFLLHLCSLRCSLYYRWANNGFLSKCFNWFFASLKGVHGLSIQFSQDANLIQKQTWLSSCIWLHYLLMTFFDTE